MTRLKLEKLRGEPLGAPSNRAVRLLAFRHPLFPLGGWGPYPLARFHSLLFRNLTLEVSNGLWERYTAQCWWHRWHRCRTQLRDYRFKM